MGKKKGKPVDKPGSGKVRKVGAPTGVGSPGTTTYTGKPGVSRGSKKGY